MGTIPTIQLILSAGSPATSPGGTIPVQAAIGSDSAPFDDASSPNALPLNIITFDIYENGIPMADGRLFQVSHFTWSTYPSTVGPLHQVSRDQPTTPPLSTLPITACADRINAPIYYTTADNCWTVFYKNDDAPLFTAEIYVFKGKFISQFAPANTPGISTPITRGVGPGMVPVFVDAADLAGTEIAGYDSSNMSWCLATAQQTRNGAGGALTYSAGLSVMPDLRSLLAAITNNGRICLNMTGTTVAAYSGPAERVATAPIIDIPTGQSHGYFGSNAGFPRTYRRGDAHATYDWPGFTL